MLERLAPFSWLAGGAVLNPVAAGALSRCSVFPKPIKVLGLLEDVSSHTFLQI